MPVVGLITVVIEALLVFQISVWTYAVSDIAQGQLGTGAQPLAGRAAKSARFEVSWLEKRNPFEVDCLVPTKCWGQGDLDPPR